MILTQLIMNEQQKIRGVKISSQELSFNIIFCESIVLITSPELIGCKMETLS